MIYQCVSRQSIKPLSEVQRPYNLHVLTDTTGRELYIIKDPDGTEHQTRNAGEIRTETDAQGRRRAVYTGGG